MKAIICGAGIVGLALANRLHHYGWDVCVTEKAPGPRTDGYMISFFGPGYEAVTEMGLLSRLHELGQNVSDIDFVDSRGKRRTRIPYASFERAANGDIVSILRSDLELLLREAVGDKVELRYGTTIEEIRDEPDGATVTMSDGSTHAADLVVGADGIHSRVRSLVFGPESEFVRFLNMHTAAFVFDDPEVYQQVNDRFVLIDNVGSQLGFYGLRDGSVATFAVQRGITDAADSREAVLRSYREMDWTLPRRAMRKCPPAEEIYFDRVAQIDLPRWSRHHTVLLGDSAYAVSLVAGQGSSLGITGAYVLAERLHAADSVPEALDDFERRMRPLTDDRQSVVLRSARSFPPTSSRQLWMRHWAMLVLRVPGIDRYLGSQLIGKLETSLGKLTA